MNINKIPIINKIYIRFVKKFAFIDEEINSLAQENISLRFKLKQIKNEKINVLFICWRPAVWGSLKTVYESMKKDEAFNVKIVIIPNKKLLPKIFYNHEQYESEGAESFWTGDDVIMGYNYKDKIWLNIRDLQPDYVCLQRPYNECRSQLYKSWNIAKYSRIFYVAYFTFLQNKSNNWINENTTPSDFFKNVSLYFSQCKEDYQFMLDRFKNIGNKKGKVILTGFPAFDNLSKTPPDYSIWNFPEQKKIKILWTPRWCTSEFNCHFFSYKDLLIEYCREHKCVDFIIRPHPQMFDNFKATGEMTEYEYKKFEALCNENNIKIDFSKTYLGTLYSTDILITDITSIIPEYCLTGKPIIYCNNPKSKNTFEKNKGYAKGFYWVESGNELRNILDMLLRGEDPLQELREELIKSEFYLPKEGAGFLIKEAIKQDFNNA